LKLLLERFEARGQLLRRVRVGILWGFVDELEGQSEGLSRAGAGVSVIGLQVVDRLLVTLELGDAGTATVKLGAHVVVALLVIDDFSRGARCLLGGAGVLRRALDGGLLLLAHASPPVWRGPLSGCR
jgi:hypothetical protein